MALKGVILAAGYGTRFLPVTRVVPKELLPIVDRPALALVVDELVEAGCEEILLISSRRKRAVEDWFDHDPELEAAVAGHPTKAAKAAPPTVPVHVVRQHAMRGTGHALLQARSFAGNDPVLVAFPDDLFGQPNPSKALVALHRATGASVLATQALPDSADVSAYGVLDAVPQGDHYAVRGIVEKPAPGTEPSRLISLGRYLYTPELFDLLAEGWARHTSGEFYPMDALGQLAAAGRLLAAPVAAHRWDTGQPLGYFEAVLDGFLADPHHRDAVLDLLRQRTQAAAR